MQRTLPDNTEELARQIMNHYRRNPKEGFRMLYDTYAGRLQGYAQKMLSMSESKAEDLVHDAFLPWVENPDQMKSVEKPAAYLFTSIRHLSQRFLSRDRKMHCGLTENDHSDRKTDIAASTVNRLNTEDALNLLPSEQKEVLLLRLWEDLSLEEVAQIQQASIQTVASRYRYALRKLKEILDHE